MSRAKTTKNHQIQHNDEIKEEVKDEIPEMMKPEEVCQALDIHVNTFLRLARTGKLPAVKIGGRWYVNRRAFLSYLKVDRFNPGHAAA